MLFYCIIIFIRENIPTESWIAFMPNSCIHPGYEEEDEAPIAE